MGSDIAQTNGRQLQSAGSIQAAVENQQIVHQAMRELLERGKDYAQITGMDKPILLRSGAEKLCQVFSLSPDLAYDQQFHDDGHYTVVATVRLIHRDTGQLITSQSAVCSTRESKYAYRYTEVSFPNDWKDRKAEYRAQGYKGGKRNDGSFYCMKRSPNPDLADTYNTILQMAAKRALVMATRVATASSALFDEGGEESHIRENVYQSQAPEASPPPQQSKPRRAGPPPAKNGSQAQETRKTAGYKESIQEYAARVWPELPDEAQGALLLTWDLNECPRWGGVPVESCREMCGDMQQQFKVRDKSMPKRQ